jgi:hypothetical protein
MSCVFIFLLLFVIRSKIPTKVWMTFLIISVFFGFVTFMWSFVANISWDILLVMGGVPLLVLFTWSNAIELAAMGKKWFQEVENMIDLTCVTCFIVVLIITILTDQARVHFVIEKNLDNLFYVATLTYAQRIALGVLIISLAFKASNVSVGLSERLGILIIVLGNMMLDFFVYLVSVLPFFIGFSLAFTLLFGNLTKYGHLGFSLLQAYGSLRSQFTTSVFAENRVVGPLFYIVWDIIGGLFLFHILIALLNGRYVDINTNAKKVHAQIMQRRAESLNSWASFIKIV